MQKDYRPYIIKKVYSRLQRFYTFNFIRPKLNFLGIKPMILSPWNVKIFGFPIKIGDYVTIIAASDKKIRFVVWSQLEKPDGIKIGNFCIISPGVRISSAFSIKIGDSCMIASNVYISDSDWHGVYNRISFGKTFPIDIAENVWVGDSSIICKGVNIGKNSIIGAGSIVTNSVPDNVIVAGNPARVVKRLSSVKNFVSRKQYFSNPAKLIEDFRKLEINTSKKNTFLKWILRFVFPSYFTTNKKLY